MHQVVVAGLAVDFPPLRSLDVVATNLPRQLTSFVGRDDEITRVATLAGEHRLVTLTGAGGVGKTRLALQVAADLMDGFPGGAWVSELAPANDDESMLEIVATTFSVQLRTGAGLIESIAEALRSRQLLWVLDNCEHLVLPAAQLANQVLRSAPGITILATSREALGIDGEYIVGLRPMAVAALGDHGGTSDASRLFADRAQAVRHDFQLDERDATQVDELCRRLDGIPLAIELAASRTASMTVSGILEHLDERFRLLTGGRRVALERQQTLRGTLDWSYSLLDPVEQHVFTRLSVFSGSFDADAVVAVTATNDHDDWDVRDALDGLVRKSMVAIEESPDGTTQHGMLETMREYGQEVLDREHLSEAVRRRHAEHYAGVAEAMRQHLLGPDEFAWRP